MLLDSTNLPVIILVMAVLAFVIFLVGLVVGVGGVVRDTGEPMRLIPRRGGDVALDKATREINALFEQSKRKMREAERLRKAAESRQAELADD